MHIARMAPKVTDLIRTQLAQNLLNTFVFGSALVMSKGNILGTFCECLQRAMNVLRMFAITPIPHLK